MVPKVVFLCGGRNGKLIKWRGAVNYFPKMFYNVALREGISSGVNAIKLFFITDDK
jgi:hypothetical protein